MSTAEDMPLDLEELLGPPVTDEELTGEPPHVEDQIVINRRLKRLGYLERLAAEKMAIADANRAQIDAWLASELAKLDAERGWIERQLEGFARWWARSPMGRAAKAKTLRLPNGSLSLKSPRPRIEVTDPEMFVQWAESHAPRLVRLKVEPDKTELAKLASGSGEMDLAGTGQHVLLLPDADPEQDSTVVPGVLRIIPAEDSFSYKIGGGEDE